MHQGVEVASAWVHGARERDKLLTGVLIWGPWADTAMAMRREAATAVYIVVCGCVCAVVKMAKRR